MKPKNKPYLLAFTVAGLLALATFVSVGQKTFSAEPPTDPAHAAHLAAGTHRATNAAKGDPALVQQLSQLQVKVAQLEAALAKFAPPLAASPESAAIPGATAFPTPAMSRGMGMGKMKPGGMEGMGRGTTPAPRMAGMSDGAAAPATGSMNMMGMMDKMMGMMDKMMGMGGGAMPAGAQMGGAAPGGSMMDMDDKMEMGGMGMMDIDKMGMAKMMGMMGGMGKGGSSMAVPSALPGFPGASHLYHIGATGFFLDHPQHIALTTQQQAVLNSAKEKALLAKSTADRAVEQAEQELWMLTAADQPDAAKIQAKLAEIATLTGDERLAFIRAVGDASKLLTDEQRKILTGFAAPVSAIPAAAPMAGMKDM